MVEAGDGRLAAEVLSGDLEDKENHGSEQIPAGEQSSTSDLGRKSCVSVG